MLSRVSDSVLLVDKCVVSKENNQSIACRKQIVLNKIIQNTFLTELSILVVVDCICFVPIPLLISNYRHCISRRV
jgi:hypothetical protein